VIDAAGLQCVVPLVDMSPLQASPSKPVVYGRLLRLSLAPSALADVAAGALLGGEGSWPRGAAPFLLMLASSCIYHGAMALNDWADREHDGRTRPERPIPSGGVPAGTALLLGILLPLFGVFVAASIDPLLAGAAAVVAVLATGYDLFGRGPWSGPLLLGSCRAGNMSLGILLGTGSLAGAGPGIFLPAVVYGLYVVTVSRLGRLEDGEESGPPGDRPARLLRTAAAWLLALPLLWLVPGLLPGELAGFLSALGLAVFAASGLVMASRSEEEWTPATIGRSMGLALRRLLVLSASTALLCAGTSGPDAWLVAAGILLGYPFALGLRRVFPPS